MACKLQEEEESLLERVSHFGAKRKGAAARAAQRSLKSTLGATGSKPLHGNPDKEP